jgi:hypothetical protein
VAGRLKNNQWWLGPKNNQRVEIKTANQTSRGSVSIDALAT